MKCPYCADEPMNRTNTEKVRFQAMGTHFLINFIFYEKSWPAIKKDTRS